MFALVLWLHSMVRWAVVVLGFVAVYRAWRGQDGQTPWRPYDTGIAVGFAAVLDIQLVIGSVLWLYSPISILGIHEPDLGLKDRVLRFWTFEHPVLMLAAIVLAHVGLIRIRRLTEPRRRHRAAAVYIGLALVLVLAGIPWPFLSYGRALAWPMP
jgi:hypothetical protein